jgi:formate dehydrogenase subunit beta
MAYYAKLEVKNGDTHGALKQFFDGLLGNGVVDAVMVPSRLPYKRVIMQTLIRDKSKLNGLDPLAPVVPTNSARFAAQLTHDETGKNVGVVMRSCEIRPFFELVKLKQGRINGLLIIGSECLGRYENSDFLELHRGDPEFTLNFYKGIREGKGTLKDGKDVANACKACEYPVPEGVDIRILIIGIDIQKELILEGVSEKGKGVLSKLGLPETQIPSGRDEAVKRLIEERIAYRDKWLEEMNAQTKDLEGLMNVLGNCINCYNCRVACPVCYCRECVFVTDTFQHQSDQYLRWAEKRGILKLPTDTLFYHLTRMQHMSTLCVGCGQCSSACPNDIPLSQLFRSVARDTQRLFGYIPGRNVEEPLPLAVFYEKEFEDVAAGK